MKQLALGPEFAPVICIPTCWPADGKPLNPAPLEWIPYSDGRGYWITEASTTNCYKQITSAGELTNPAAM